MAHGKFYVGQVGARFIIRVEEDTLSGHLSYDLTQAEVSTIGMEFKSPDRRIKGPYTSTIRSGTSDEMEFTTTDANLLDIDGVWKYRGVITTTDSDTYKTLYAKEQVVE